MDHSAQTTLDFHPSSSRAPASSDTPHGLTTGRALGHAAAQAAADHADRNDGSEAVRAAAHEAPGERRGDALRPPGFDFTTEQRLESLEHQLIARRPGEFRPEFSDWLSENWHVWREFARVADRLWARGRRHWSSSAIVYYIRQETALAERDGEWKINQNNARDLAWLYVLSRIGREDFFEFRQRADSLRCRRGA